MNRELLTEYAIAFDRGRIGECRVDERTPFGRPVIGLVAFAMTLTSVGIATSVGFLSAQNCVAALAAAYVIPAALGGRHIVHRPLGFFVVVMSLLTFLSLGFLGGWVWPVNNYTQPEKATAEALGLLVSVVLAVGLSLKMLRNLNLLFVAIRAIKVACALAAAVALIQEIVWIVSGNPDSFSFDFLNSLAGQPVWWYANMVGPLHRVNSYLQEPAHLGRVLIIVVPLCLMRLGICGRPAAKSATMVIGKWTSVMILLAFLLTFSIAAWAAVLLGMFCVISLLAITRSLPKKVVVYLLISAALIVGVMSGLVDETFGGKLASIANVFDSKWWEEDSRIGTLDISALAMAASVAVTRRNVSEMPLVGAGFGGHPARFAEIAGNRLDALGVGRLNAEDAGSLLLRSVSETGLLGLSLLLLSIVIPTVLACLQVRAIAKWRQAGGNSDLLPLLSALIGGMSSVFVVYLIRNGHYFDLNFWLPFAIMLTVGFCRPLALNHCFAQQPRLRRWRVKLI